MARRSRRGRRTAITRDSVLFSAGLAGVFYCTVFDKADRPTLLLLFGAMMGLPAFLRTDDQVKSKAKALLQGTPDDEDEDPKP